MGVTGAPLDAPSSSDMTTGSHWCFREEADRLASQKASGSQALYMNRIAVGKAGAATRLPRASAIFVIICGPG
jgi:hypothetical protein